MTFSDVYETMMRRRQRTNKEKIFVFYCLKTETKQKYHKNVFDFRREIKRKLSEKNISDNLIEFDIDNKIDNQYLGII